MTISPALAAYRGLTGLLEGVAPLFLRRRVKAGKEDPRRLPERLGHASLPRPAGPLIWMHGASVGESLSLLALIDRLRAERPASPILVTSGTVTSAELLAKRLPEGVIHQFAPIDQSKHRPFGLFGQQQPTAIVKKAEFVVQAIVGEQQLIVGRGVLLASHHCRQQF